MSGADGREHMQTRPMGPSGPSGQMGRATQPEPSGARRMPQPADVVPSLPGGASDVLETLPGDETDADALLLAYPGAALDMSSPAGRRLHLRQLIREFLRAVPRSETETTLAFARPDGSVRTLTRAQLTRAIDALRPRQRQIVRLALEERWPRQRVCEYLHNISLKTFERDQVEALDLLAEL